MARDASTYRAARRNLCIRDQHQMWGRNWYYGEMPDPIYRTVIRRGISKYHPLKQLRESWVNWKAATKAARDALKAPMRFAARGR